MPSVDDIGEPLGERRRVEMEDVGAERGLQRVVGGKRRRAGLRREKQVPALARPTSGLSPSTAEEVAGAAQEVDAVERDFDVHGRRELLANAARRQRRRGGRERRVLLDDEHAPAEAGRGEMIGEPTRRAPRRRR